ncbi:MAG: helix-turn-helix transcriptional regulator [Lachnospiraceae bacterium]|nr:helix-turn-helix transcriptional regulator [Lachnospiraceae bacterium]
MRKNLKEARQKAGMTQKQVAEYLGITEQHYQRIEYGTTMGKIALWDKLEDLFNVHQRVLREIHHDKAIHQEIHQE